MSCKNCLLNTTSQFFMPSVLEQLPTSLRNAFFCSSPAVAQTPDLFALRQLCARDLWVLTFIGSQDQFAADSVAATFDRLVAGGHSELLCHLFENANYEIRRTLWDRMVELYPHRLYLFDSLFEKDCLPPANNEEIPENQHVYRHYLLYGSAAAAKLPVNA